MQSIIEREIQAMKREIELSQQELFTTREQLSNLQKERSNLDKEKTFLSNKIPDDENQRALANKNLQIDLLNATIAQLENYKTHLENDISRLEAIMESQMATLHIPLDFEKKTNEYLQTREENRKLSKFNRELAKEIEQLKIKHRHASDKVKLLEAEKLQQKISQARPSL